MSKTYNTEPVKQALQTAKTSLILLPKNPSLDVVAAGLGLYLSLTKKPLTTSIGCATPMTVNFNRLFGVDKIKPRIGNQNLVISFNYPQDTLEKVSYDKDPDTQKFHLTIEPKAGQSPLDPSQVEYSYTGSQSDLIFVIASRSLEDLGPLYEQEKKLFEDKTKPLVNLSHLDKNTQFGTVNLYDPTSSGCSEIVFAILQALELPLEPDIVTNLLAGIEQSTNNFATATSPDTFEIVAQLMRAGAQKGHLAKTPAPRPRPFMPTSKPPTSSWPQPSAAPSMPTPLPSISTSTKPLYPSTQTPPPSVSQTQTPPPPPPVTPSSQLKPTSSTPQSPSPDWLKPKVVTTSGSKI